LQVGNAELCWRSRWCLSTTAWSHQWVFSSDVLWIIIHLYLYYMW